MSSAEPAVPPRAPDVYAEGVSFASLPPDVSSQPASGVWSQHHTPEGKPYYYNNVTRQSVWEKPMDFDSSVPMPVGIKRSLSSNNNIMSNVSCLFNVKHFQLLSHCGYGAHTWYSVP